jgi:hypothetical protein
MSAVRAWLRIDLRRRSRSLAVLALLVAVSAGTVLTAVAGARRGESALPRLAERTLPATAAVLLNQPGFDWDAVRAMPEVETLSGFALGPPLVVEGVHEDHTGFLNTDGEALRTVERPVVFEGRVFDPDRADEAVVSPEFVERYGKDVGDTLTLSLYTPQQVKAAAEGDPGPPGGPRLQLRIVGVIRSAWYSAGVVEGDGIGLQVSPGVFARYHANLFDDDNHYVNAMVRLRGGERALPAFEQRLAQFTGHPDIDVWNFPGMMREAQRSFTFQARSLLAFGAAALVAALLLVGQAVARYAAASAADLQVLQALGMTRRQSVLAAAAGPFLAAVAGTTLGVVVAGVASRWFPIGTAAAEEPAPGILLDRAVLGGGWLLIPLLVAVGSATAAWLALRSQWVAAAGRRSSIATAAARAGLPVPVVVGTRFALEAGRGRTAVPVRPALFGAVAGVLGILAAFTFSSGVSDASSHLERFGQTWQLETFTGYNGRDFLPSERVLQDLAEDQDVAGVNDARLGVARGGGGSTPVSLFSLDPVGEPLRVVLTAGRLPAAADEVVLGPGSAAALPARIGSRVRFEASREPRWLTVVGLGFVPQSPHNKYDSGGLVTPAGFDALFTGFKFHLAQITLRPGADVDEVQPRLAQRIATLLDGAEFPLTRPRPPDPITELRAVRVLPVALGAFLVVLALGAVGHALATAVRRRRHDVAVLRALGMTRRQSRGVVVTQATVLAAVGLAFGVPLGLAVGRTLWRVVADYTPVYYVPPLALWALVLVCPLALLAANALAAWPGHQAARLRVGHVLRAE